MTRGTFSVADLKRRSVIDPVTGCWHWQGAMSGRMPRIYTWDHARNEKVTMSGPKAVWNIAYQAAPLPGWLVFRGCLCHDCVNPVHHKDARSRAEIGLHIRRSGKRKGTCMAQRRASAAKGRLARGMVDTPAEIVLAIRAADPGLSHRAIGKLYGVCHSTVGSIRRGRRRWSVGVAA